MAGGHIRLFCQMEDGGEPFSVELEPSSPVDVLKDAIKKKRDPVLNDIAASDLALWKVTHGSSQGVVTPLAFPLLSGARERMDPTYPLSRYFPGTPAWEGRIHIVVARPPARTPAIAWAQALHQDLWESHVSLVRRLEVDVPPQDPEEELDVEQTMQVAETFDFIPMDVLPSLRLVFRLMKLPSSRLLIRKEYVALEHYVQILEDKWVRGTGSSAEGPALVVCGNPGIGKSVFLYYLLINRLKHGKPTAFQSASLLNGYVLFDRDGANYHPGDDQGALDVPGVMALADAFDTPQPPCVAFTRGPAMVVHSSSPREERYKGWMKQKLDSRMYWMNAWTWSEMWLALCHGELSLDLTEVRDVFTKWSPCICTVHNIIKGAKEAVPPTGQGMQEWRVVQDIGEIGRVLSHLSNPAELFKAPSSLVLISADSVSRGRYTVDIVTKHVARLIEAVVHRQTHAERRHLASLLTNAAPQAATRGLLFELRAHWHITSRDRTESIFSRLLPTGGVPPLGAPERMEIPVGIEEHYFDQDSKAVKFLKDRRLVSQPALPPPLYCKPVLSNFPAVDAFIVSPLGMTTLLQMTVSETRSIQASGMKRVRDILTAAGYTAKDDSISLSFVFVSPSGCGVQKAQKVVGRGSQQFQSVHQYVCHIDD